MTAYGHQRTIDRWILNNLLLLLCLATVATGTWGFWTAFNACGPRGVEQAFEALYRTLQMFGLNFDLPDCAGNVPARTEMNPWLHLARLLGFLALYYAVLSVFFASTLNNARIWLQIRFRAADRHVLLGFGEVNRAAASVLRRRDPSAPILAIDRFFDDVDRRVARDLGIELLAGDLSDPNTLRRARVDRARRVTVAVGDDIRAIEVARAIAPDVEKGLKGRCQTIPGICRPEGQEANGDWVLRAHISDPVLLANLTDTRDLAQSKGLSFQPFNLKVEAAAGFVYLADLVQRARDHGQRRVHLVVVGLGDQGEAILIETLLTSYAHDLLPPRVTVLDRCNEKVDARLRANYPRLMEGRLASMHAEGGPTCEGWGGVTFKSLDAETCDFTSDELLASIDGLDAVEVPTAWVFCCGDDRVNLAAALRLEVAMQQRARRAVPIFIRQWGSGLQELPGQRHNPLGLVQSFGSAPEAVRSSPFFSKDGDDLARSIHLTYLALGDGRTKEPATAEANDSYRRHWLELPEAMRAANRRPARHLSFKLRELGFDWKCRRSGKLPKFSSDDRKALRDRISAVLLQAKSVELANGPTSDFAKDDPALLQSALIEHSAWVVERAANGWRRGPESKHDQRLQKYMVPFVRIGIDTKSYDLAAIDTGVAAGIECGKPLAHARSRCVVAKDNLSSVDLKGKTEFELHIDPTNLCGLERVADAVSNWAKEKQACRLHIVLNGPVQLPPGRNRLKPEGLTVTVDATAITSLARIVELPDGIVCDVTRLYEPVPIPPIPAKSTSEEVSSTQPST